MGNNLASYKRSNKVAIEIKNISNKSFSSDSTSSAFLLSNDDRIQIIINIMMPLYYTKEILTEEELYKLELVWMNIKNNNIHNYIEKKSNGELTDINSCFEWFKNLFFQRLYHVHPICRSMFESPQRESLFIHVFFSFIFTALEDTSAFNDRLFSLARAHCKRGVKACEYSIIGDVMVWTFKHLLGPDFTYEIYNAWVKLFSLLLTVMIPVSVKHEYKNNASQLKRFAKSNRKIDTSTDSKSPNKMFFTCPFSLRSNLATVTPCESLDSESNNYVTKDAMKFILPKLMNDLEIEDVY